MGIIANLTARFNKLCKFGENPKNFLKIVGFLYRSIFSQRIWRENEPKMPDVEDV
jgi:hypothetical protein